MGPTILFTQLKIILLQCFQFSVFSFQFSATISSIQTDPYCYGENHIVDFCWELYGKPTVHQASFQAEESTSHSHPPTSRVVSGPEEEYNRPCLSILILLGLALKLAWLNKVLPLLVFPLRTLGSLTQVLLIV